MTTPYRVLITGSRTWDDHDTIRDVLAVEIYQRLPAVIVHGACPTGADAIASWWVRQISRNLDLAEERHPAEWQRHGRGAGFRRNAEMVAAGAAICLAFIKDQSRGATHCANAAEKAGIPVRRWTA